MAPKIIHIVYFPWDRQQRLLDDPAQFDRTPLEALRAYAPDFEVRLWTYPDAKAFCQAQYPEIWRALQRAARPVMLVDVFRWVAVLHFGGIYWQLGTTPLVPMEMVLPSADKEVRLFTEFELSPEQCADAAAEPIRAGEPEEPIRILIQAFSARPHAAFVRRMIDVQMDRLARYDVKRDYDILFITGNAAASTAYARFGQEDAAVERMPVDVTRRMMKWHYKGTWRTGPHRSAVSTDAPCLPRPRPVWRDRVSAWRSRWRTNPRALFWPKDDYRSMLAAWAQQRGLARIDQAPIAGLSHMRDPVIQSIPETDLLVIPDYLERLGAAEVARALRRAARSPIRYLALTHHPLVMEWWPAALGDYRPLNYRRSPFNFPEPVYQTPCPLPGGRPDRVLAVWSADELKGLL